jgi:hypothetical protein
MICKRLFFGLVGGLALTSVALGQAQPAQPGAASDSAETLEKHPVKKARTNSVGTNPPASPSARRFGELEGWPQEKESPASGITADRRKKHEDPVGWGAPTNSSSIRPAVSPYGYRGGKVGVGLPF